MVEFAERFPNRYHDVAIAEQHAVTLAAGLACEGQKPVVAIYSTFLQRAYDQLVHDVAIQNLDVTFGIDRAGLVGEDGPTHAGAFDLSFMRCIPNMIIAAPSDENECRQLLCSAYQFEGPAAVRYPRGAGTGVAIVEQLTPLAIGKAHTVHTGTGIAILCFGTLLASARQVAQALNATLVDMRWVKPLDEDLIKEVATKHQLIVTLEENTVAGGAGSAVSEFLCRQSITVPLLQLGIPDRYIEHAKQAEMLAAAGLDAASIKARIDTRWSELALNSAVNG